MDDEQKPDSSLPILAVYHHKVASLERSNANLSFKEWMNKRTVTQANPPIPPSMNVQPFLRLPTPPLPLMIKDEPWQGPSQLPSTNKLHNSPSNKMKHMLPFSSGNPNLQIKAPSLKPNSQPNPNPTIQNHRDQGPKLLPKTGIPTRPHSFLKRKAIDNEQLHKIHSSNEAMIKKKSAENLLCHLCHVSCSSALTMKHHLVGRPHKAKMEYMKMKRDGGRPRCEVCEIWCCDVASLEMHLKGQKHKSKVSRERGSKAPVICELCSVPCMNQELFEAHLKGRQHATKLELRRRGFISTTQVIMLEREQRDYIFSSDSFLRTRLVMFV